MASLSETFGGTPGRSVNVADYCALDSGTVRTLGPVGTRVCIQYASPRSEKAQDVAGVVLGYDDEGRAHLFEAADTVSRRERRRAFIVGADDVWSVTYPLSGPGATLEYDNPGRGRTLPTDADTTRLGSILNITDAAVQISRNSRFEWGPFDLPSGWGASAGDLCERLFVRTGGAPCDYDFGLAGEHPRGGYRMAWEDWGAGERATVPMALVDWLEGNPVGGDE